MWRSGKDIPGGGSSADKSMEGRVNGRQNRKAALAAG